MSSYIKFRKPVTILINSCKITKCPYQSNNKWYISLELTSQSEKTVHENIFNVTGDDFEIREFVHQHCIYVKIPFKYDKFTCTFENCTYSELCENDLVDVTIQCAGLTKIQETYHVFFKLLKILKWN